MPLYAATCIVVDDFLRGDGNDVDTTALDVAVVNGSLGLRTAPTANPALLGDLRRLAAGELLEGVAAKRRAVVERWQKAARGTQRLRVQISNDFLPAPIVISADTDFHEKSLERLTQRGAKAWRDVPDAGAWVDDLRGNDA